MGSDRGNAVMGEVVILPCETKLDIPPQRVLQAALENPKLTGVILIGIEEDEIYYSSSLGNVERILWDLEKMKQMLLRDY